MGRFNVSLLRYMTGEEFRVLQAVETGMRNHELVPASLVSTRAFPHITSADSLLEGVGFPRKRLSLYLSWKLTLTVISCRSRGIAAW